MKWTFKGNTRICDIGDERLTVYYHKYPDEEGGRWMAKCGDYLDHSTLMADNVEDAKQEAVDDLLNIASDRVVKEAMFLQDIIGAGL